MRSGASTRWCAAGHSSRALGADAAREAARRALADAGPLAETPADTPADTLLAVVFASSAHRLEDVAAGLRDELPASTQIVGCTTSGEITHEGSHSASLALMLFGGSGFSVRTAYATGLHDDSAATGQAVAERLYSDELDPLDEFDRFDRFDTREDGDAPAGDVVILLSDGLSGDQQAMVTGVYRVTGAAIPLVGGCAGDDLEMAATAQLIGGPDGDVVLRDSVVGVRLRSDAPVGIGVRHGWTRLGEPLVVTGTSGAVVHTLDDEPALDAYLRMVDAPEDVRSSPGAFTRFALNHPLGIAGRSQDLVRFVTGADFETRSLNLVAPVPQGCLTWIMSAGTDAVLTASGEACQAAIDQLAGLPAKGVIAFNCIARRAALGQAVDEEIAQINHSTAAAPMIGFYTYGEIARTQGLNGFHNQTLVVLALA